ncbi:MAG TPA: hypothetical protein VK590_12465 [Saprospiraceae bacterium]|nr:hypothetical protein [Saprospiraceae bacterium]
MTKSKKEGLGLGFCVSTHQPAFVPGKFTPVASIPYVRVICIYEDQAEK